MSSKLAFTIVAVVSMLQGLGIYFGAAPITESGVFNASLMTPEGIRVGTLMHQAMGSTVFSTGLLLFFCRGLEGEAAQRVLLGAGIAFAVMLASACRHLFLTPDVTPPVPAVVVMAIVMVVAFLGSRAKA